MCVRVCVCEHILSQIFVSKISSFSGALTLDDIMIWHALNVQRARADVILDDDDDALSW